MESVSISVKNVLFCAFSLFAGFFILALSLQSSSASFSPMNSPASSQRPMAKLLSSEMLPGNPMYSFLMVKDRAALYFTLDPVQNAYLRVEYANRRLGYAKELFSSGEDELAMPTLAKAQMYLGKAIELFQEHNPSRLAQLRTTLVQHRDTMTRIKETLTDANKARIDQLLYYNLSLIQSIPEN